MTNKSFFFYLYLLNDISYSCKCFLFLKESYIYKKKIYIFCLIIRPRAAAVGERLWSDQSLKDAKAAAPRIEEHRCRMVRWVYLPNCIYSVYVFIVHKTAL
jgi:hypothetical protein